MTPTPLSPQVQADERLAFEAYSRSRTNGGFTLERMSDGRYTHYNAQWAWEAWLGRAELALSAVPFNQVVQEPPFVRESQLKELFEPYATNMGLRDFEESEYGYTNSRTAGPWGWFKAGADAFRSALRAASPQPAQPGEALPAEQPKSDQANLESASGGNDLQTALPEQPSRRREDWLLWDRCYDRQQGKSGLSFLDCVSLFADAVRRVALPVAGLSDAQIKAAWLEVGTGPNGDNLACGTNLTGWTNAVRWAESRHGIGPALAAAPAARNDVRGLLRIADQSRTERRHPVRLRKGAVRNHGAEAMTNQADKPSELVINQQKTPENGAISLVDQLMELARQYARAYFNCYTYEKVDESADLIERRSALRAYAERLASQSAAAPPIAQPVATMVALDDGLGTVFLEFLQERPPAGTMLYAAPPSPVLLEVLEALQALRAGLLQMREHAEQYGQAWAHAYVKEYRDLAPGSAKEQFDLLGLMHSRLADVDRGLTSSYDAIAKLRELMGEKG